MLQSLVLLRAKGPKLGRVSDTVLVLLILSRQG